MSRIDLNLLQALEALLRERSVSRAAKRLGIGQPAMSAALARLRSMFADPLFVRTPRGMEPTPRAQQMSEPLRAALAELRSVVEPSEAFDATSARRTFRVSGGDYVAMVVLPSLMRILEREARSIDLRFRFVENATVLEWIDTEEIDLALCVMGKLPRRFEHEVLITDTFVCIVRRGHPLESQTLTVEQFIEQRHILVTERGDETGAVDEALRALGKTRRVVLTVPQVSLVPMLLAESNAVATVARRAAECIARTSDITDLGPPIEMPSWQMSMIWSARKSRDDGLVWLRRAVQRAAGSGARDC